MTAEKVLPAVIELLQDRPVLTWIHVVRFRGWGGCPDLIIIGSRVLWRECKPTRFRSLQPLQTAWRWKLAAAGEDWAVWDQLALDRGDIERELDALMTT